MRAKIIYLLGVAGLLGFISMKVQADSYCRELCRKTCSDFYSDRADAHSSRMKMCVMTCVEHKCPPER